MFSINFICKQILIISVSFDRDYRLVRETLRLKTYLNLIYDGLVLNLEIPLNNSISFEENFLIHSNGIEFEGFRNLFNYDLVNQFLSFISIFNIAKSRNEHIH